MSDSPRRAGDVRGCRPRQSRPSCGPWTASGGRCPAARRVRGGPRRARPPSRNGPGRGAGRPRGWCTAWARRGGSVVQGPPRRLGTRAALTSGGTFLADAGEAARTRQAARGDPRGHGPIPHMDSGRRAAWRSAPSSSFEGGWPPPWRRTPAGNTWPSPFARPGRGQPVSPPPVVPVRRGTTGSRPATPATMAFDEALRPDGGHGDRRRDRAMGGQERGTSELNTTGNGLAASG